MPNGKNGSKKENQTIDPSTIVVKSAYDYLKKISPDSNRFSNFRLEEISLGDDKNYLVTLSYEITGDFGFDKQKEYKDFKVSKDGVVIWMKIRRPNV